MSPAEHTIDSIVLFINPTAGGGKASQVGPRVAEYLRDQGITVTVAMGSSAEEGIAQARAGVQAGCDALVACGGDGTVHAALQLVAGTDTALGIIPMGTGDDNARTLSVPLGDPQAAARVVAAGHTRQVDAGVVTCTDNQPTWFLGVMSSGFDSLVNERANAMSFPKGKSKYAVATMAELRVFNPIRYSVRVDDTEIHDEAMLVAVGNGLSYGGGMKVCPHAVVDDGELEVTFLSKVGKWEFLRVFPRVFKGTHVTHPAVKSLRGRDIDLDAAGQVVYADGERIGHLPAHVECRRGAVRALVPADAVG